MAKTILAILAAAGMAACTGDTGLALDSQQQAIIVANCEDGGHCASNENCDPRSGEDCLRQCDDNGTNCSDPETCSPSAMFCCQSVFCLQNNDPNYYVAGIQTGCHTGVSCQPCPTGTERDKNNPGNPSCCTPTFVCTGIQCGQVVDSCGWPSTNEPCGSCGSGQACTNGTCVAVCGPGTTNPCSTGCCDANHVCQPGTAASACGTGGAQCTSCSSGECSANHTCLSCGPLNCPNGCCSNTGTCEAGTSNAFCGGPNGQACDTCSFADRTRCTNRFCLPF